MPGRTLRPSPIPSSAPSTIPYFAYGGAASLSARKEGWQAVFAGQQRTAASIRHGRSPVSRPLLEETLPGGNQQNSCAPRAWKGHRCCREESPSTPAFHPRLRPGGTPGPALAGFTTRRHHMPEDHHPGSVHGGLGPVAKKTGEDAAISSIDAGAQSGGSGSQPDAGGIRVQRTWVITYSYRTLGHAASLT